MTTTLNPVTTADGSTKAKRRRSRLERATATRLAAAEFQRWLVVLPELRPADWAKPTDCTEWDVRQMVAHVLGMAELWSTMREQVHQLRTAGKAEGVYIDELTALQVRERESLTPAELIERLRVAAPKAVKRRARFSRLMGARLLRPEQSLGPGGGSEWWSMGYLTDVILTRDAWMHRVDLTRATGRPMELTADHDGALVGDAVLEWAGRHGRACTLHLTGPAGGAWQFGTGGEELSLDAIEFCRSVTGRERRAGLLGEFVPF